MKKIIFVLSFGALGGIEKSLLNLLYYFDFSRYSVDVALINKNGDFFKQIPKEVNIIDVDCFKGENWELIHKSPYYNLTRLIKTGRFITALVFLYYFLLNKYTHNKYQLTYYKWITRKSSKLASKYDVAIAYGGPNNLIDFYVYNKIDATKKIGWIHFDISKFGSSEVSKKTYNHFHKICVVSDEAKRNFIKCLPQYENKTITFYNKIIINDIIEKSNEGIVYSNDKTSIKLLTVGRFTKEKGQILAIESLKILIEKGYKINWYFVGDGPTRNQCECLAKDLGIYEHTFFEGNQINPYVYMKNCDIYVQPSIHEGFCITLAEALCFKNPIVTTNFAGAEEQLINRKNAIITEFNAHKLSIAIINAMSFQPLQNFTINNLNESLNDLYNILDE